MQKNDYIKYIHDNINSIEDEDLKSSILQLINERNNLLETIKKDSLTGAYNRRILNSVNDYSVVVLCDIDNFKTINDKYGHDIGDRVLKTVTQVLFDNTRSNDVVCRYGGDEFLIVFKRCGQKLVKERMNYINNIIRNSFNNARINVSLSIGISAYEKGKTLEDAIKEADIALYNCKEHGKYGVVEYNKIYIKQ